ncbi:MAG: hypothetical protein J6D47_18195 [Peptostreptococcaceae bacterium]|nr:hypothetical protein [Peptostreptococcaceae bacterium]
MATKRTSITLSEDMLNYYQDLADQMGIPRNAAMVMALKTYMDQQKSLDMGAVYKAMEDLTNKLEQMKGKENE